MVTFKLTNDLLVFIQKKYTKENGEGIGRLKFSMYRTDDDELIEFVMKNSNSKSKNEAERLLSRLIDELDERGFVNRRNMMFTLTVPGWYQANKLMRPILYFLVNYWKWYIPIVATIIVAMVF